MHKVADLIAERSGLPLLHIGDEVGNAVKEVGLRKVGLLGTRFLMEEHFYRDRLRERYSIDVVVPGEEEQAGVHRIIGGFHGFHDFSRLKGLSLICPCHCTQYKLELRRLFPEQYVACGAGIELEL